MGEYYGNCLREFCSKWLRKTNHVTGIFSVGASLLFKNNFKTMFDFLPPRHRDNAVLLGTEIKQVPIL